MITRQTYAQCRTGHDYDELPDTYVIFICDYDPLQMGKYVYNIDSRCRELPEYEYKDGEKAGHAMGLAEGRSIGIAEGEAIGEERGEARGVANTLSRYLLRNPSADTAADIFGMPVERVRQIAAENGIALK